MLDNFFIAFNVNLLAEVLFFLILRRKNQRLANRKVSSVPRTSDASKSTNTRTSDALKSSSGSELKHCEILYALVYGPDKVQIVKKMEELSSLYEL